jgi:hypothetical protein
VDDRAGHTAEHGLDHVEELGTGWQWCSFDRRSVITTEDRRIMLLDALMQALRDVPGGRISGKVQLAAVSVRLNQKLHHSDHLGGVFLLAIEVAALVAG